jgi:hypothetical protein
LTANLSAFAGQTVRLRIANAVTEEVFNAGVDGVSISSGPPGSFSSKNGPGGFRFGRPKVNRRTGIATLRVSVVGSGLLRAAKAPAPARVSGAGKVGTSIEPVTVPVATAKTVTVHLRPTPSTRALLRRKHRLRVRVGLTYMPTGGVAETGSLPVMFQLGRHRVG